MTLFIAVLHDTCHHNASWPLLSQSYMTLVTTSVMTGVMEHFDEKGHGSLR